MKIDRSKVLRAFSDYVEAYDSCNQRIMLKIEHSKRVAGLCERIAESNGLKQDDLDLAWTIGLLHDMVDSNNCAVGVRFRTRVQPTTPNWGQKCCLASLLGCLHSK